jgi:chromate transport protein ChrA
MGILFVLSAVVGLAIALTVHRLWLGLLVCLPVVGLIWFVLNVASGHGLVPWQEWDFLYLSIFEIVVVYLAVAALVRAARKRDQVALRIGKHDL